MSRKQIALAMLAMLGIVVTIPLVLIQRPAERSAEVRPREDPPGSEAATAGLGAGPATPSADPVDDAPSPGPVAAEDVQPWEKQIDEILTRRIPSEEAGRALVALLPTLPEEGQIEAADHAVDLVEDADFGRLMPILMNPATPQDVVDILFTDLMNRGEPLKMRAFLEVAKARDHAYHEEAREILTLVVGEDFGDDWPRWQAAVEQYLKDTGDGSAR